MSVVFVDDWKKSERPAAAAIEGICYAAKIVIQPVVLFVIRRTYYDLHLNSAENPSSSCHSFGGCIPQGKKSSMKTVISISDGLLEIFDWWKALNFKPQNFPP